MQAASPTVDGAALRWILLSRVVLGTVFVAAALALRYTGTADVLSFRFVPVYAYASAIYASSSLLGLWGAWRGQLAGWSLAGLSALDLLLVFALTTYTGASQSPFLFLYLFIIIGAAVLRLRRGALVVTALSMSMLGITLVLESHGKTPLNFLVRYVRSDNSTLLVAAFYNISAFYVVGILSSYLAERLRRAGEQIDRLDMDISILQGLQDRIIDNVASGLLTTDEQGRIILANRQAERILGISAIKLRGANIHELLPGIDTDSLVNNPRLDMAYQHPDHGVRFLGYSVSSIRLDAARLGFVIVFQDLTRMKELESAVKRQEKLAALGSMAAGIAHEIRNPLGSISGSLQLLKQQHLGPSTDERALVDIALREIDRLNNLVNDFLLYARPNRGRTEPILPRPLIEEICEAIGHSADVEKLPVFVNEVPADFEVKANPGVLRQALWNLVLNAIQAKATRIGFRSAVNGAASILEVEDNGVGIPAENIDRLFEPFFTTRADGVGLGLAIVYRMMEEHGGNVVVKSAPGSTTMRLQFEREERPGV